MALIGKVSTRQGNLNEEALKDRDQILAYLEELFRVRAVLCSKLEETTDLTYAARIEGVNEEKGSFTISMENRPPQEPKPGTPISFFFVLDGLRFRAQAKFLGRSGYMQSELALPEKIFQAERRAQARVRFNRRENTKALVLEQLGQGLAISGPIINLSPGGFCLRVDRVVDSTHDRRIKARTEQFVPGAPLALIRLQDLPQTPTLECAGTLCHVDVQGETIYLGIELAPLGAVAAQGIAKTMAQKTPTQNPRFPFKRRRGAIDTTTEPFTEATSEPDPAPEDLEPIPEPDPPSGEAAPEQPPAPLSQADRKTLLRRRASQILLVASDEMERAILMGTLFVDGYRNLHEASGLVQALDMARRHNLDVILLEQQVGKHSALEIVQQLRMAGRLEPAKVVILRSQEDIKLKMAEKGGTVHLTVAHPVDFDGILKPELERILGLADQA